MRISTQFVAVALSVKENISNANGNERKYYQISLDQDGECGSMSCTEEVFKTGIDKYKPYLFTALYNDNYKSFNVTNIIPYNNK